MVGGPLIEPLFSLFLSLSLSLHLSHTPIKWWNSLAPFRSRPLHCSKDVAAVRLLNGMYLFAIACYPGNHRHLIVLCVIISIVLVGEELDHRQQ